MTLEYKGYTAAIDLDPEDGTFSGRVQGLRDVIHFEGTDGPSLFQAFRDSVDDYLAFCAERGEQPDTPLTDEAFERGRAVFLVRRVREATGLTQRDFAARYGIPLGTLCAWEQGSSQPDAVALSYLQVIAKLPEQVAGVLSTT